MHTTVIIEKIIAVTQNELFIIDAPPKAEIIIKGALAIVDIRIKVFNFIGVSPDK